jgi:hypothetical protein
MSHAVGSVYGNDYAHAFIAYPSGIPGQDGTQKCGSDKQNSEASQEKNQQIFELNLARTSDQSTIQKLHRSPLDLATMLGKEKVDYDGHRDSRDS